MCSAMCGSPPATSKPHAKFLKKICERISHRVKLPDGTYEYQLKGIDRGADGSLVYDLTDVSEVQSFVNAKTGKVEIDGVVMQNEGASDDDSDSESEVERNNSNDSGQLNLAAGAAFAAEAAATGAPGAPAARKPVRKPLYAAPAPAPALEPVREPTPEIVDLARGDALVLKKRLQSIKDIEREGDALLRRVPPSTFNCQKAIDAYNRALQKAEYGEDDLCLGTAGKYIGESFGASRTSGWCNLPP